MGKASKIGHVTGYTDADKTARSYLGFVEIVSSGPWLPLSAANI